MYCQSHNWWKFCKILWPSQNIWTLKTHGLKPSCPEIKMFMNLLERTQQTWWTLKNIESVFLCADWGWIMTPFITPLWHSSLSLRVLETTPSSIFRAHCNNDIKLRDHPYIMFTKKMGRCGWPNTDVCWHGGWVVIEGKMLVHSVFCLQILIIDGAAVVAWLSLLTHKQKESK